MAWLVVRVREGYGVMSRVYYEGLPGFARREVEVLAVCSTDALAKRVFGVLPQGWDGEEVEVRRTEEGL